MIATPPIEVRSTSLVDTYCDKPFQIECPYNGYPELNYTWVFWRDTFLGKETEGIV